MSQSRWRTPCHFHPLCWQPFVAWFVAITLSLIVAGNAVAQTPSPDAAPATTPATPAAPTLSGDGAITGRIVQGTAGADLPAAQPVTLMAYVNFAPVATLTTTTDLDGAFAFEQLATTSDVVYFVGTRHADVAYGSDLLSLSPLTPTQELELSVFETTTDPSTLHISRMQWVVDHQPGALHARQVLLIANSGDRTVVGRPLEGADLPVTAVLPVPANAVGVSFQDGALGARYQQVGDLIYDTTPIRPGTQSRQVLIGYALPYTGTEASLTNDFAYPVDALTLLIADLPGLVIEVSDPLEDVGNQTIQGAAYRVFNGQLADAQPVTVALQNLTAPGSSDPRLTPQAAATPVVMSAPEASGLSSIPPIFAALGAGALVLVVGASILSWKYARDKRQAQRTLLEAKERLLTEIAMLDDRHAQGELDDESWSAERLASMQTLRTVTDELERRQSERKGAGARG